MAAPAPEDWWDDFMNWSGIEGSSTLAAHTPKKWDNRMNWNGMEDNGDIIGEQTSRPSVDHDYVFPPNSFGVSIGRYNPNRNPTVDENASQFISQEPQPDINMLDSIGMSFGLNLTKRMELVDGMAPEPNASWLFANQDWSMLNTFMVPSGPQTFPATQSLTDPQTLFGPLETFNEGMQTMDGVHLSISPIQGGETNLSQLQVPQTAGDISFPVQPTSRHVVLLPKPIPKQSQQQNSVLCSMQQVQDSDPQGRKGLTVARSQRTHQTPLISDSKVQKIRRRGYVKLINLVDNPWKRKAKAPSGVPEASYHEFCVAVDRKSHLTQRTRTGAPCFRCQVQKLKCEGGFPCVRCQKLLENANALRSRQVLNWTVCFDADIEKLNTFSYALLQDEDLSLEPRHLRRIEEALVPITAFLADDGCDRIFGPNWIEQCESELKKRVIGLSVNAKHHGLSRRLSKPTVKSAILFNIIVLSTFSWTEDTPKLLSAALGIIVFKDIKVLINNLRLENLCEDSCADLYWSLAFVKHWSGELQHTFPQGVEMSQHLIEYVEYFERKDQLAREIIADYMEAKGSEWTAVDEEVQEIINAPY